MAFRVIQWTTGNVGKAALRVLIENPAYELVGVYAHGGSKAGVDAGDLCGLPDRSGVTATGDADALIALKPDVCVYCAMLADPADICRLLEAGIDVISVAGISASHLVNPELRARIETAAQAGGSSYYATGMYPGFAHIMAAMVTQPCNRVQQVRLIESVDTTAYASWEIESQIGFGQKPGTPGMKEKARAMTTLFSDAVEAIAAMMDVQLDGIEFDIRYALATAENVLDYATIHKGEITGLEGCWTGWFQGRSLIDIRFRWLKGANVEDWFEVKHGYFVEVDGTPTLRAHVEVLPPADDPSASFVDMGMISTAMGAINAIPRVVAARPGVLTVADLGGYGATSVGQAAR